MDIVVKLLFWLHIIGLTMGGVSTFGIPIVGSRMPTATPETRPTLFAVIKGLSAVSRAGLGTLIVTGLILIAVDPNIREIATTSWWFWLKMALVVILLAGVIYAGTLLERAKAGDLAAAQMQPRLGAGLMLVLLGVVLSAVFTFD